MNTNPLIQDQDFAMPNLIPIQSEGGKPSVDARELHAFLQVGRDFATWINDRVQQFGFVEGQDFSPVSGNSPVSGKTYGGRPAKEYSLSLDMAKELSMVERSERGKQARRYFIECERRLLEETSFEIPKTLPDALRLAADLADKVAEQATKLIQAAPKVEFYDRVTGSGSDVCQMAVAAQVAKLPFGRNILFQKLRQMGILISGGDRHNMPYQKYIAAGLFTVNERKVENPTTGEPIICFTTYVTQRGIAFLVDQFGGGDA